MRISTRQIYTQGIEAFQQQQQKLAKLQQQEANQLMGLLFLMSNQLI